MTLEYMGCRSQQKGATREFETVPYALLLEDMDVQAYLQVFMALWVQRSHTLPRGLPMGKEQGQEVVTVENAVKQRREKQERGTQTK